MEDQKQTNYLKIAYAIPTSLIALMLINATLAAAFNSGFVFETSLFAIYRTVLFGLFLLSLWLANKAGPKRKHWLLILALWGILGVLFFPLFLPGVVQS